MLKDEVYWNIIILILFEQQIYYYCKTKDFSKTLFKKFENYERYVLIKSKVERKINKVFEDFSAKHNLVIFSGS